ncbi:MAG: hypothetical protein IPK00_17040 [Deltaproteobacteria bacterium]|nr:hypothetical protein [Deltaproteobacteria bacterium]
MAAASLVQLAPIPARAVAGVGVVTGARGARCRWSDPMDACDPLPPLPAPIARGALVRRRGARPARRSVCGRARRGLRTAAVLGAGLAGLALALTAPYAQAQSAGTSVRSRALLGSAAGWATTPSAERAQAERWRSRGLAYVDLPFGLRARYDAQALLRPSARSPIATTLFDVPAAATARRTTRLLESRFAVSRVLGPRVELELSWATRSPLAVVDLMRIEDQRVTAMIRFVP